MFSVFAHTANHPPSEEPASSSQCIPEEDQSTTREDNPEAPNAFDEFITQNNPCKFCYLLATKELSIY